MGHVVDKVVLDFAQLLLLERQRDGVQEHAQQQEGEGERGHQELDRREDVVTLVGEGDVEHVLLAPGVVGEQYLGVHVLLGHGRVAVGFIDNAARAVHDGELKGQRQAVELEFRPQVTGHSGTVGPLLDGAVARVVQDGEDNLVQEAFLVQVLPLEPFLLLLVGVVQVLEGAQVGGTPAGRVLSAECRVDGRLVTVAETETVLADARVGLLGLGQVLVKEILGLVLLQHRGYAVEAAHHDLAELAVAHGHHLLHIHDLHGEQSQQGYRHHNRQYPYR